MQDEAERQADEQAEKLARARRASARAAQALGLPPPGTPPPPGGAAPLAKEATLAEMREVSAWAGVQEYCRLQGFCSVIGNNKQLGKEEATLAELHEAAKIAVQSVTRKVWAKRVQFCCRGGKGGFSCAVLTFSHSVGRLTLPTRP
eukprot:scaffold153767_cov14-Tisochrysis_lutea.AAC.1